MNFPVVNAYQTANAGAIDGFVSKLNTNATGSSSLVYSTYLGGTATERAVAIAVDETGHAYVTGRTESGAAGTPFPTRKAFQNALAGSADAFVAKLDTMVSGVPR